MSASSDTVPGDAAAYMGYTVTVKSPVSVQPNQRRAWMKGVQFPVDENGKKSAVLIDLKRHSGLWEDFF
ncbi:MAG: hypothetical protein ABIG68_08350 [Acidobacteriota bacterium]